jgi:hypothetical protein
MWNTMRQPEAVALTEIMLGARSDPEIHGPFALLMRGYNQKLLDGPSVVAEDLGYSNTRAVRAMARLHVAAMRGLMVDQLYWDENDTGIDDAFELLVWYKRLIMRFLEEPAFKDVVHDLPRPLKRQGSVGKDPTSQDD